MFCDGIHTNVKGQNFEARLMKKYILQNKQTIKLLLVENKITNNQFIEILSQTDKYLLFKSFTLKKIN